MIDEVLMNRKSKATVHQIQKLCGYLNFLCRAIVPGRAFTRRIYALTAGKVNNGRTIALKQHHHVKISGEVKCDLRMWIQFLHNPLIVCRPFLDFEVMEPEQITVHGCFTKPKERIRRMVS